MIVQFASIWIWSGAETKLPSITPLYGGSEQLTASAGETAPSNSAKKSSSGRPSLEPHSVRGLPHNDNAKESAAAMISLVRSFDTDSLLTP